MPMSGLEPERWRHLWILSFTSHSEAFGMEWNKLELRTLETRIKSSNFKLDRYNSIAITFVYENTLLNEKNHVGGILGGIWRGLLLSIANKVQYI